MKQPMPKKSLHLSLETVRALRPIELGRVQGGVMSNPCSATNYSCGNVHCGTGPNEQ